MNRTGKLALTALVMVLAMDVATAVAVAPVASHRSDRREALAHLRAGKNEVKRVARKVESHVVRLAGNSMILIAKGASRLYSAMLSVSPRRAEAAEPKGCSAAPEGAVINAAGPASGEAPGTCRCRIRVETSVPARFYTQTS